jgi:hypothetical protein
MGHLHRMLVAAAIVLLLAISAKPASASVIFNQRFPIEQHRINDCNGEFVLLTGEMHMLIRAQPDGTNYIQINVHWIGTGANGNEYILNSQHHSVTTSTSFAETFRDRLISKGGAPNRHVLITASTDPPSFDFTLDCRG